jgi:hypothetical protein
MYIQTVCRDFLHCVNIGVRSKATSIEFPLPATATNNYGRVVIVLITSTSIISEFTRKTLLFIRPISKPCVRSSSQ